MSIDNYKDSLKGEKAFMKKATALLETEEDIKYFKDKKRAFQVAEAMTEGDPMKEAFLLTQFGAVRYQIAFLLWRTNAMTKEVEDDFRALPEVAEYQEEYVKYEEEEKKTDNELKESVMAFHKKEQSIDVFKAVCGGMAKEKAEEQLKKYEEQMVQAMQGK